MISAFDIFKPGIGPSSSHTVGPMNAGKRFIDQLVSSGRLSRTTRMSVDLYGSLSLTGKRPCDRYRHYDGAGRKQSAKRQH